MNCLETFRETTKLFKEEGWIGTKDAFAALKSIITNTSDKHVDLKTIVMVYAKWFEAKKSGNLQAILINVRNCAGCAGESLHLWGCEPLFTDRSERLCPVRDFCTELLRSEDDEGYATEINLDLLYETLEEEANRVGADISDLPRPEDCNENSKND